MNWLKLAKVMLVAAMLLLVGVLEYFRRDAADAPTWLYPLVLLPAGALIWLDIAERKGMFGRRS